METPVAKAVIDTTKDRGTNAQESVRDASTDELVGLIMDAYRIGVNDGMKQTVEIMRAGLGSVALEETPA